MLVLEEYEHAQARGARMYAELAGYSSVNSAFDIFSPEPDGLGIVRTMQQSLVEAGLGVGDVDWVNSQGFSIRGFDQMETRCIRRVFAETDEGPRVSAVSSWIGNSIGAMGGIQAALSALALDHQVFPPQDNMENPDAAYPVRLLGRQAEKGTLNAVIQNSYCFMGKNSSLVFKRIV
jgi:3-oxoacyl-[acyl-carrier-protein] synthase II